MFGLRVIKLNLFVIAFWAFSAAGAPMGAVSVADVEFRGLVSFQTGFEFSGTEVGGLSGIAYDAVRDVYYALSDDQSQINEARFYTLGIDLYDGFLDDGDITFLDVTFLRDRRGTAFPAAGIDPEGIALPSPGQLFISSEGNSLAEPLLDPFVNRFNLRGRETRSLPVPPKYLPDGAGAHGIRFNLAFESLTPTPDRRRLVTATEGALAQDGPAADVNQISLARVLEFDLRRKRPGREFVYVVDPVAEVPDPPDAFRVNGLVELLALDNRGTFLALERSFSVGRGNTVVLYEISVRGATDVSGYDSLFPESGAVDFTPVSKRFLLDFADLGLVPDNLEGLAFGPVLPDGRVPLVVVSDNNFLSFQTTQFIALALQLEQAWD